MKKIIVIAKIEETKKDNLYFSDKNCFNLNPINERIMNGTNN